MKRLIALALVVLASQPVLARAGGLGVGVFGGESYPVLQDDTGNGTLVGVRVPLKLVPFVTIEPWYASSSLSDKVTSVAGLDYTRQVARIAHAHGVPLHVDGARFFNASVALGVTPRQLAEPADSIAFCLSKGLSAPIGSMVVGSRDFVHRAWRGRKLVGGGMRQVGIIAAAGLVALSDGPDGMIERLAEDHLNARRLAEGLAAMDGIESPGGIAQPEPGPLDPRRAVTNFVVFRVRRDRTAFLDALKSRGVLLVAYDHGTIRAVTHYGVSASDVDRVLEACRAALHETAGAASNTTTAATAAPATTILER